MMRPVSSAARPGGALPRGLAPAAVFCGAALLLVAAWALEGGNRPYTLNFRTPIDGALGAAAFGVTALGVLVLADQPRHLTGRLFLAFGVAFAVALLAHAVAVRVLLVGDGPRPLGLAAAWLATFAIVPAFCVLPFVLATWPEGRIVSSRLRRAAPVAVIAAGVATCAQALAPGPIDGVAAPWAVQNPLGVRALREVAGVVTGVGVVLVLVFALAAATDVVRRARLARGEERRQLAPVAWVVVGVPLLTAVFVPLLGSFGWVVVPLLASLVAVPAAVAVAVRGGRRRRTAERARLDLVLEREEERRRLRAEIHDGVGPLLAALRLELDAGSPDGAQALLADAMGELRRISRGLRPARLDELGLTAALRHQVATVDAAGIAWRVDLPDGIALPAAVETAVFHIAHEAVTNVVRHSGARVATLAVRVDRTDILLEVQDDGCGLGARPLGVGLRSMQHRAEELGGTFEVDTTSGLRLTARLPVQDDP